MENETIQDTWYWTEKAEAISFNPRLRAGERVGGDPTWETYQAQMPPYLIEAGLVKRIRFCGDQVIWNLDELIQQTQSSQQKGEEHS